jgi:hypothetical protein
MSKLHYSSKQGQFFFPWSSLVKLYFWLSCKKLFRGLKPIITCRLFLMSIKWEKRKNSLQKWLLALCSWFDGILTLFAGPFTTETVLFNDPIPRVCPFYEESIFKCLELVGVARMAAKFAPLVGCSSVFLWPMELMYEEFQDLLFFLLR